MLNVIANQWARGLLADFDPAVAPSQTGEIPRVSIQKQAGQRQMSINKNMCGLHVNEVNEFAYNFNLNECENQR